MFFNSKCLKVVRSCNLEENDRKIIEKELDKIIDKIQNNELKFQNYSQYSRVLKEKFFGNLFLHSKGRKCSYPGCNNTSIRKSHTIPKTSSLLNIAKDGHLLKPEYDGSNNQPSIQMLKIGVNNASVFPGYCTEHENIFQFYEIDGEIDNEKKALLQTYRSICRERVFREIEIEINIKMEKAFQNGLEIEALTTLKKSLSEYSQFENIDRLNIEGGDPFLSLLKGMEEYLHEVNKPLLYLEKIIHEHIYCGSKKNDLLASGINIDILFPIALSGFASMGYEENQIRKTAVVFLNIIPLKDSTYIICVAGQEHESIINPYINFFFSSPLNILNMIESFMINGSDHWFINPNYWEVMHKNKQKKILHDILNTQNSFLEEYPISIFDDIRENILEVFIENTRNRKLTDIENKMIQKERIKLSRKDYNIIYDNDKLMKRLFSNIQ